MSNHAPELLYVFVIVGLFIFARYLQRFRIPNAISCLGLGMVAAFVTPVFQGDTVIALLSVLGISTLFLVAGMEVDLYEIKRFRRTLGVHAAIQLGLMGGAAMAAVKVFGLEPHTAVLVSLALFSPSTGFIIEALPGYELDEDERFWIKSKAIASELVALGLLFAALQPTAADLAVSSAVLAALVVALPFVMRFFAAKMLPHAPNSEFTFLIVLALIYASVTKKLGVYYLVGAFVVGITQSLLSKKVPQLATARMRDAVTLFAVFFVPFYFFHAGLRLPREVFSVAALKLALVFLAVALPLRIISVMLHRRLTLQETWLRSTTVAVAMLPTLVFTLVLAEILRERFGAAPQLTGALTIYTLINSLVPAAFMAWRKPGVIADQPVTV